MAKNKKPTNWVSIVLIIVIVVFGIVFILSLITPTRDYLVQNIFGLDDVNSGNKDLFNILIAIFGIVSLIGNFSIYSRRLRNQEKQIRIQQESNLDQRFGIAVELLGNDSESVRIGALYSLYHLAKENPKYRQTVTDIFSSHIRRTTTHKDYLEEHLNSPADEIQTALDLLLKKDGIFFLYHEELSPINLQGINLSGADLNGIFCEFVDFSKSIIISTSFMKAQSTGAKFQETQLINVDWGRSNLFLCDFSKSKIYSNFFDHSILHGSAFSDSKIYGTSFYYSKMIGIIAYLIELYACSLSEVILYGSVFSDAKFYGCSTREIIESHNPSEKPIFLRMYDNDSLIDDSIFDKPIEKDIQELQTLINEADDTDPNIKSILTRLNDCCRDIPNGCPNKCKGRKGFKTFKLEQSELTRGLTSIITNGKWKSFLEFLNIIHSQYKTLY